MDWKEVTHPKCMLCSPYTFCYYVYVSAECTITTNQDRVGRGIEVVVVASKAIATKNGIARFNKIVSG